MSGLLEQVVEQVRQELEQLRTVRQQLAAIADALLPRAEAMLGRAARLTLDADAVAAIARAVAEASAEEVREQVEAILATGEPDDSAGFRRSAGSEKPEKRNRPPAPAPVDVADAEEDEAPAPTPATLAAPADEDEQCSKGRKLSSIVKEAVGVLVRHPDRAYSSADLRAAVKCPEPRWPSVARDVSASSLVRYVKTDRGSTYQAAEGAPRQTEASGAREKARQVAALLEASGEQLKASDILEACEIRSEKVWRQVVAFLADYPQVRMAGERGGRRYRWVR